MLSIIIFLIGFATYIIYCSSSKMKQVHVVQNTFLKFIPSKYLKPIGLVILCLALFLTILKQGIQAGTFAFIIYAMCTFSLVNLLLPYKKLNWKHMLGLFILMFSIETFFYPISL